MVIVAQNVIDDVLNVPVQRFGNDKKARRLPFDRLGVERSESTRVWVLAVEPHRCELTPEALDTRLRRT